MIRFARWTLLLVVATGLGWAVAIAAIQLYGRVDQSDPADVIVVLGAAQYDGRPSPVLRARVDHAVDLYRRGVAPTLIMTGGVGPGDTVSEAVVAKRYAVRQGVSEGAVLTETGGLTSLESMEAVASLMREKRMERAVLVSDPFHMLRLRVLAVRVRISAQTSPTRTSPISRNPDQERRHVLRESLSLPLVLVER